MHHIKHDQHFHDEFENNKLHKSYTMSILGTFYHFIHSYTTFKLNLYPNTSIFKLLSTIKILYSHFKTNNSLLKYYDAIRKIAC